MPCLKISSIHPLYLPDLAHQVRQVAFGDVIIGRGGILLFEVRLGADLTELRRELVTHKCELEQISAASMLSAHERWGATPYVTANKDLRAGDVFTICGYIAGLMDANPELDEQDMQVLALSRYGLKLTTRYIEGIIEGKLRT